MCREVVPVTVSTRQTDTHPGLGRVGGIIRTERRPYSGDSAQNFRWPLGIFFYPAIPKRRGLDFRTTYDQANHQSKTNAIRR